MFPSHIYSLNWYLSFSVPPTKALHHLHPLFQPYFFLFLFLSFLLFSYTSSSFPYSICRQYLHQTCSRSFITASFSFSISSNRHSLLIPFRNISFLSNIFFSEFVPLPMHVRVSPCRSWNLKRSAANINRSSVFSTK